MKKLLLALLLAVATPSCATVAALLPHVIAAVVDGAAILDTIERFVTRYFAERPDPVMQVKVDTAIQKARRALNVALRTAEGADKLDRKQVDAAFEDFKQAYLELLALVRPYGVSVQGEPPGVSPDGKRLEVPSPLALRGAR